MRVVSDTSPISYLVQVEVEYVLPRLFGAVYIPAEVLSELQHPRSPRGQRYWAEDPPSWLRVVPVPVASQGDTEDLARLDVGERAALALSAELNADLLLVDERAAREVARRQGRYLLGTLGVLDAAGREGWIDVHRTVARLRRTSFRASSILYRWLLDRH